MLLEQFTHQEIGTAVHDTMNENGCDLEEAVEAVLDALCKTRNSKLRAFLRYGVKHAERDRMHSHPPRMAPANASRRKSFNIVQRPQDATKAVGNTGVRKRLGDLTWDDVNVIYRSWDTLGKTVTFNRRMWLGIRDEMKRDEILEQAMPRMSPKLIEFLYRQARLKPPKDDEK